MISIICFKSKKPYIKVGSKYLGQGKMVLIKRSIIHPNWGASQKDHPFDFDFQLLEMEETLNFNENVQSIKIARLQDMVVGKVITVTGWGNTVENVSKYIFILFIKKQMKVILSQSKHSSGHTRMKEDVCNKLQKPTHLKKSNRSQLKNKSQLNEKSCLLHSKRGKRSKVLKILQSKLKNKQLSFKHKHKKTSKNHANKIIIGTLNNQ